MEAFLEIVFLRTSSVVMAIIIGIVLPRKRVLRYDVNITWLNSISIQVHIIEANSS